MITQYYDESTLGSPGACQTGRLTQEINNALVAVAGPLALGCSLDGKRAPGAKLKIVFDVAPTVGAEADAVTAAIAAHDALNPPGGAQLVGSVAYRTSTPQTPAAGLLTWTVDDPGELTLATGVTLQGLELTFGDATPILIDTDMVWSLLIRAETTATVNHADVAAVAEQRIHTLTGAPVVVTTRAVPCRYRYIGGAWAWYLEG